MLSLLAIRFVAADAPAGMVELDFSGGATIRLDVECIEARLADLGGAWEASSRTRPPNLIRALQWQSPLVSQTPISKRGFPNS